MAGTRSKSIAAGISLFGGYLLITFLIRIYPFASLPKLPTAPSTVSNRVSLKESLLPRALVLLSPEGTALSDVLLATGILGQTGKTQVQTLGFDHKPYPLFPGFSTVPALTIDEVESADLLILPRIVGPLSVTQLFKLRNLARKSRTLLLFNEGGIELARTGLLRNRTVAIAPEWEKRGLALSQLVHWTDDRPWLIEEDLISASRPLGFLRALVQASRKLGGVDGYTTTLKALRMQTSDKESLWNLLPQTWQNHPNIFSFWRTAFDLFDPRHWTAHLQLSLFLYPQVRDTELGILIESFAYSPKIDLRFEIADGKTTLQTAGGLELSAVPAYPVFGNLDFRILAPGPVSNGLKLELAKQPLQQKFWEEKRGKDLLIDSLFLLQSLHSERVARAVAAKWGGDQSSP